jgi:hypothetical protein
VTLARSGWTLLAAAGVAAVGALALGFTGQAVGLGSASLGGLLVIAILALLGAGTAVLALANSSHVLRSRVVRTSLAIFAVGALMEAASATGGASSATDALESWPVVILMLGGGVMMLLGVAALAVTVPLALRSSRSGPA